MVQAWRNDSTSLTVSFGPRPCPVIDVIKSTLLGLHHVNVTCLLTRTETPPPSTPLVYVPQV